MGVPRQGKDNETLVEGAETRLKIAGSFNYLCAQQTTASVGGSIFGVGKGKISS